jgi:hypothetical protein
VYHTRYQFADKGIPILVGTVMEVVNILHAAKQSKYAELTHAVGKQDASYDAAVEENALVAAITALPGVENAFAVGYQLIICKGRAFEWSEIEPHVAKLVATFSLGVTSLEDKDSVDSQHS